jgi:AcrR family transcriptional regulator
VNKTARSVRAAGAARPADRALVAALVELVLEKRFDAITVQQVLDRADVGRTTFYARYRGKDDLLVKSFERMLEGLDHCLSREPGCRRVAPVRELFEHVRAVRGFHQALSRSRSLDDLYDAGVRQLSTTIAARLAALPPNRGQDVPVAVMARAYSGAVWALLRWWLEGGPRPTPAEMDRMFHEMVWAARIGHDQAPLS